MHQSRTRKEPVMGNGITYVGLDTSKESIVGYVLSSDGAPGVEFKVPSERTAARKMVRKLGRQYGSVSFCYEAGPCGYQLQRWIRAEGAPCVVVAPALIPRRPGEKIKTDRRDAKKLAELYRAGLLVEVHPPTLQAEAVRDLVRGREDLVEDMRRMKQRILSLLLRRGLACPGVKGYWGVGFWRWLRSLAWEEEADRAIFSDYLLGLEQAQDRLRQLEARIAEVAASEPWAERVGWLCCLRGIKTLSAMTLLSELHGWERFRTARELMSFLGLVPSEHSSGERERRGRITGAGNIHARRILIETSQNYRVTARVTPALAKRRQGQPAWVIALADRAQQRLNRRFWRLLAKGKLHNKVVVAVARELVGFIWAILQGPRTEVAAA